MAINLQSVKNAFGHAAQDIVKVGKAIKSAVAAAAAEAPALVADLQKAAPTIEGLTALAAPEFVAVEQLAFNAFGVIANAVEAAGPAAASNGLSISLDQTLINDVKAILPAVKSFMAKNATSAPAAAAASAPAATTK
jgi:hypothetical protein